MDDYSHLRGVVNEEEDREPLIEGETKHHSPEDAKKLLAKLKEFSAHIERVKTSNY